jgi:trimethylamine--corrinoid protein Co-methyltransferase
MGTAGASDAKTLDQQAALEMGIQILLSALSGASLVHDLGFLDSGHIGSLPMVVLADEVISKVRHMMRGPEINHETIMQDVIEQAGPGGQFMAEMRSVALCRQEIWVPTLMERGPYSLWEAAGGKSLADRTQEKLSRILSTHQPPELPDDVVAQINQIVAEMEGLGVGD